MKLFTKRFIHKIAGDEPTTEAREENAAKAQAKIGLPVELYSELAKKYPFSNMARSINGKQADMHFFAGLIVGWAEANKKIK